MLFYCRACCLLALALLAASLGASPVAAQGASAESVCVRPGVDDKCEAWVASYDDSEISETASQFASDVATSTDGERAYLALNNNAASGFDSRNRWTIIAYDARTGDPTWVSKWGDGTTHNTVNSVEVSPDGELIYATGNWRTEPVAADAHMTTIAFSATTGDAVWQATYDVPGEFWDNGGHLAVSPDGGSLFVAGVSSMGNGDNDYVLVEYDARTGAERWVTRWNGLGLGKSDSPMDMKINRAGAMLYATGWSGGDGDLDVDFGTIAVVTEGPDEGNVAWSAHYDRNDVKAPDQANALALTPDGSKVFVTGLSDDTDQVGPPFRVNYGYATVAYDAQTGQQLWETWKQWPGTKYSNPNGIVVDPSGQRLVVTGQSGSAFRNRTTGQVEGDVNYGTVAYSTESGEEVWSESYGLDRHDSELAKAIAMDPDGKSAYVTGYSSQTSPGIIDTPIYASPGEQLTIAYDVATGERTWLARYAATATNFDSPQSIVATRDGSMAFTATNLDDQNYDNDRDDHDVGLLAYELGLPVGPSRSESTLTFTDRSATSGEQGEKTLFEARLTDSGDVAIPDAELTFELTGPESSRSFTATTDDNGVGSVTPTLEEPPGTYELTVRFAGDDTHEASEDATAFVVNQASGSGDRRCTTGNPIVGQTVGNVVVPQGESCVIMESTVSGNIKAEEDSSLDASTNAIKGNVEGDKAEQIRLNDNEIGGNVNIKEGESPDGDDIEIAHNVLSNGSLKIEKYAGDISVTHNTLTKGDLTITDNVIGVDHELVIEHNSVNDGSLKVEKNTGSGDKSVIGNEGGKSLTCNGNGEPFTGTPNGTWEKKEGQCAA